MKITCFGAESEINQIARIRQGFQELGHQLVSERESDIIFVNDPSKFSNDYRKNNPGATIIYNLLDIPPHLLNPDKYDVSRYEKVNHGWNRNFDIEGLKEKIKISDILTCICLDVKRQIKDYLGLEAHCIYNPIKNVSFLNLPDYQKVRNSRGQRYKYLFVGRACDPNKNFLRIMATLQILGDGPDSIAVVGSEDPKWGNYMGILSDSDLELMYNSVDYLFLPASYKSIGLPLLESVVTRTRFLVSEKDPCTQEFVGDLGVPSDPYGIANLIKSPSWNEKCQKFVNDHSEEYKQKFSPQQICKNILKLVE